MAGPLKEVDVNQYGSQQKTANTEVVHLVTPVELIWRREVPIDSSALIAANTTKGAIEFDPTSTTIPMEGDWVVLDATTGEASLATDNTLGYLVWAGRGRLDVPGSSGVTVLVGDYVAETTLYSTNAGNASWGDPLYIYNDATNAMLGTDADIGANTISVARFEGTVTRNGETYIRFRSVLTYTS